MQSVKSKSCLPVMCQNLFIQLRVLLCCLVSRGEVLLVFFFPVCCGFNQDFKIFLTRISNGLLIETVLVTACVFKWW